MYNSINHLILVSTKRSDIILHPFECESLIPKTKIKNVRILSLAALRESQWSEAVVESDEDEGLMLKAKHK